VTTTSWDDATVILPNRVLEVAIIGKQVGLVRVDKPIAYLDIDDTGLVEAGYGPSHSVTWRRNASQSQRDSFGVTTFHGYRSRTTASYARAPEARRGADHGRVSTQEIDFLRQRGYGARPDDPLSISQVVSSYLGYSLLEATAGL
jgi:hypothetical protein